MKRVVIAVCLISLIILIIVPPGNSEECRSDIDGNGTADGNDLAEMASDYGNADCPVKTIKYIVCDGVLSSGGRWCDNADGSVTDMTTGLVWLQDTDCLGSMSWNDAIQRPIELLRDGVCGLSDGSVWGEWRLPKDIELDGITQGTEAVRSYNQYWFTGVKLEYYWSRTRVENSGVCIYTVMPGVGTYSLCDRTKNYNVWPVFAGDR